MKKVLLSITTIAMIVMAGTTVKSSTSMDETQNKTVVRVVTKDASNSSVGEKKDRSSTTKASQEYKDAKAENSESNKSTSKSKKAKSKSKAKASKVSGKNGGDKIKPDTYANHGVVSK